MSQYHQYETAWVESYDMNAHKDIWENQHATVHSDRVARIPRKLGSNPCLKTLAGFGALNGGWFGGAQ